MIQLDPHNQQSGRRSSPRTAGGATRRALLAATAAFPASAFEERESREGMTGISTSLTIYSPAPPTNPMHGLNRQLARAAAGFPGLPPIETVAMALPESVNTIADMIPELRRSHLPIVTTADFRPSREGAGPAWHRYRRANRDLKLVATLYDVGFGIQTASASIVEPGHLRGKRIGVPPRPSAVRLLTEALLRDGWDVLDDVTFIEIQAPQVEAALASGVIDATSWNLVTPSPAGFRPMLNDELRVDRGRYLVVNQDALDRINAANPFRLALTSILPAGPRLLSFAQALAAWDDTDPSQIGALLACLESRGVEYLGLPDDAAAMTRWPDLSAPEIHPAALDFYARRGLSFI